MIDSVTRWAELELAPWNGVDLSSAQLADELRRLAETDPAIVRYRIAGGVVEIRTDWDPPADPDLSGVIARRRQLYHALLQQVVDAHPDVGEGELAISLRDRTAERFTVPVFAFQKRRSARTPLLPDVDLIQMIDDWTSVEDRVPFNNKRAEAIFVGSTTGGVLTAAAIENGSNARLRAATFFRDRAGVVFDLPRVVQCDRPETEALVRALGVGGRERGWPEQFQYRYLLSMDGNGATCSRVAAALRSHSVLVKYGSPNLLYYFHGLEPWRHYVPVQFDEEVLDLVADSERTGERDRSIADRSGAFAETYLSKEAVLAYTAALLRTYFAEFGAAAH